jgi:hypothetical protein
VFIIGAKVPVEMPLNLPVREANRKELAWGAVRERRKLSEIKD